jgi:hypothetical protein
MIHRPNISILSLRLVVSLLFLLGSLGAAAQGFLKLEKDTIPLFRGFALSFDMVGAAQMMLSDHGQYEGAFRLNLHDQYFPIAEIGYGHANHENDEVTGISYKTSAPYFRVGVDVNVMKKKHTGNRVYVGARYGFTSYNVDINSRPFPDPTWQWETSFGVRDEACSQHWAEFLFGIDAKVFGPFHLGWSARYKFRLAHDDGKMGKTWYVPGFGMQDTSSLGATFNVIIDI